MTANEEIKQLVLNHLLDKYPAGTTLGESHWNVAYKLTRANAILNTIQWKLEHLTAVR